jgi:hypothetical protein
MTSFGNVGGAPFGLRGAYLLYYHYGLYLFIISLHYVIRPDIWSQLTRSRHSFATRTTIPGPNPLTTARAPAKTDEVAGQIEMIAPVPG